MEATVEHISGLLLVSVKGRLDTATAPALDAQLAPLLVQTADGPQANILLDLGKVAYISSAGLRSILHLVKHAEANGGRVGLCGAPPHIMEVMEISGFPSLLDVYPDRETALAQHTT